MARRLTEDDKRNIRDDYFIPEGTKEIYEQELDFIIGYKEELLDVLEKFWQAKHIGMSFHYDLAVDKAVKLAQKLDAYMKKSTPANIMRNLVFINNIQAECRTAQSYLLWTRRDYPYDIFVKAEQTERDLCVFYMYVCAEALLEDGLLDKVREESAKIVAERIKALIENDFLKHIDGNNYCLSDLYYLMAHFKQSIEKKQEEIDALEKKHCVGCFVDDCMLRHCETMGKRVELEQDVKKLNVVYQTLVAKSFSQEIPEAKRVEALRCISGGGLRQLTNDILGIDLERVHISKRLIFDLGEKRNICIERERIIEYITDSLITLGGINNWKLDDISNAIILNDVDLSRGTGDMLYHKFISGHEETKGIVQQELQKGSMGKDSLRHIFEEYKKAKNDKQELGGNE